MDGLEPDTGQQPSGQRRRDRLRAFIRREDAEISTPSNSSNNRQSRLFVQMPSLLRRLTTRRASTQPRPQNAATEPTAPDSPAVSSRRGVAFVNASRTQPPQISYIQQQTVTTISERQNQEQQDGRSDMFRGLPILHADADLEAEDDPTWTPTRRRRLSLQMSNFFSSVTSPRNRAGMLFPSDFCTTRPLSPTQSIDSSRARSRASVVEPLSRLESFDLRPPTPAGIRAAPSQESLENLGESEYEHGYTPRQRRPRPQPYVAEPHDRDYVQRRGESSMRSRRATWGAGVPARMTDSLESFSANSQRQLERLTPSTSFGAPTPPRTASSRPHSSVFSRALSSHSSASTPPQAIEVPRSSTPDRPRERRSIFRSPALSLRNRVIPRRQVRQLLPRPNDAAIPEDRMPLAELSRLLASYAAQTGTDRDPDGHQETTVDGGTITIYGIRRVAPRSDPDGDDDVPFSPSSSNDSATDDATNGSSSASALRSRGRPRRPRRIFNFYGLDELESLPRDLEQTFDRLRRNRRPRSMFGSGSLRRNGVVEPDVPGPSESSQNNEDASSSSGADNDETWIFYIVSAVLPDGHPLLNAPSLFSDNPTYEDMLFLDSFMHKPVASRTDVATAPGLYRIHRRSNGDLYASGEAEVEDIEITTDRCLICLSDFEETEEARQLTKCDHVFHKECIDTWLTEGQNTCPLCRGEGVKQKQPHSPGASFPLNVL